MSNHKIWISTGKSRWEKNWKNTELTWEKLVERLGKPTVTKESYAEYLKLAPKEQGNVKDIGGFVGGVITGGRRKINTCSARFLITLDIDDADYYLWESYCLEFPNAAVMYSTHKHSRKNPRYRLVIPLAEEVHSDEYEAIARKIAETIGIEYFVDDTTFQPERLMYWPSVSSDGEWVYEVQDGPFLNPNEWLEKYLDWHDTASWPRHSKVDKKIRDALAKQENPLEKVGFVGAFCKAYGIREAIEKWIPEVYAETEHQDRWTYVLGSTHGGMIVYDDLFSFSHHSTDPSQGRLCNSFDLVRIHLYSDADKDVSETVPGVKSPSYVKMIEMVAKDGEVRKLVLGEKLGEEVSSLPWVGLLEIDKKGNVLNTANNVLVILENDEWFKDNLCYDDLNKTALIKRDLPWRTVGRLNNGWLDSDDANLRIWLEKKFAISNMRYVQDALVSVISRNTFHPVKQYLEKLRWDGKARVERLLVEYLGADDNPYTRAVTRKTLVAAVARVYEPGCKFDTVLTLVGAQGVGKSRLIGALGMRWFSDSFGNLRNPKDAMEQLLGVWIMEIGELAGLKKHEVEVVKLFIAKRDDRFRVAFGHHVENFPRQCIFIATTNDRTFLKDETGNRRWWPVEVNVKWLGTFKQEEIDQIWAEAATLYGLGEDLHLDREMDDVAKDIQDQFTEWDVRIYKLKKYLDILVPENWQNFGIWDRREFIQRALGVTKDTEDSILPEGTEQRNWITVPEIWAELFNGKDEEMDNYKIKFIRSAMNQMNGWDPKMLNKKPFGYQRGWIRQVTVEDLVS